MTMPLWQALLTVGAVVLGTVVTRFLPFVLFPAGRQTPKFVQYLGHVLPFAALGFLVVYSLKDVTLLQYPFGIPTLLAVAITAGLHLWRKNMLLSVAGGTILYVLLVNFIF